MLDVYDWMPWPTVNQVRREARSTPSDELSSLLSIFPLERKCSKGTIKLNVAGIDPAKLDVRVDGNTLTVSAEGKAIDRIRIDPEAIITATYRHGILEIQLNPAPTQSRIIKIGGLAAETS